ncbi:unnamed protein product [Dovyalis caffra]|uniref:Uncharacterized protein n=1 Tax=Dovyalis caffra TaxID=77055 RepID=A0AAV1SNW2_9ROSI|nr:unnamed protein product [Dovyalis caffra]
MAFASPLVQVVRPPAGCNPYCTDMSSHQTSPSFDFQTKDNPSHLVDHHSVGTESSIGIVSSQSEARSDGEGLLIRIQILFALVVSKKVGETVWMLGPCVISMTLFKEMGFWMLSSQEALLLGVTVITTSLGFVNA